MAAARAATPAGGAPVWPTFIIGGAMKGGTTALYEYVRQHPDAFMAQKELQFFDAGDPRRASGPGDAEADAGRIVTPEAYAALFASAARVPVRGEASAIYLYSAGAAARIRALIPDVRLVFLLRHPAERAFSAYLHLVREGREPIGDFAAALAAEPGRIAAGWSPEWHYLAMGRYADQVGRYLDLFPREQLLFLTSEELDADPVGVSRRVFAFVGLREDATPETSIRFNATGVARSRWAHRAYIAARRSPMLRALVRAALPPAARRRVLNRVRGRMFVKPGLDAELRRQILAPLAGDIARTGTLIGRDLSGWLAG